MHSHSPRITVVAIATLGLTLLVQGALWFSYIPHVDGNLWISGGELLTEGIMQPFSGPIAPHPGTTITIPLAGSLMLTDSDLAGFDAAMTILMSVAITLVITTAYLLRSREWWWLGVAPALIPNALYLDMTPPSALAAVLSVETVLLLLYSREKNFTIESLALVGTCLGFLAATRIDTAILMMALCGGYALWHVGMRAAWIASFAGLFFIALDPYIWINPVAQFGAFLAQVGANVGTVHEVRDAYGGSFLACISLAIGCIYAVRFPVDFALPRDLLVWLIVCCVGASAAFLMQEYHPLRYFFPFILIWETMFPLFMFHAFSTSAFFSQHQRVMTLITILLILIYKAAPIAILLA